MNANDDRLVWTEEDLDDERQIDTKPPWWGPAGMARALTWAEADELDIIPDVS